MNISQRNEGALIDVLSEIVLSHKPAGARRFIINLPGDIPGVVIAAPDKYSWGRTRFEVYIRPKENFRPGLMGAPSKQAQGSAMLWTEYAHDQVGCAIKHIGHAFAKEWARACR